MFKEEIMEGNEGYDYIKPKHYFIFSPEDVRRLAEEGKGIDVCAIANASGLDKDAYMFNVLKYNLRKNKPNEPRSRDVRKIRDYCDIWLNDPNNADSNATEKTT